MVNSLAQVVAEARITRACRTSTRARSCGISAWSIPTTAGRSISPGGRACSTRSIALLLRRDRSGSRAVAEMLANWRDGRIKLLLTAAGLRLRREKPACVPRRGLPAARDRHHRARQRHRLCAPARRGRHARRGAAAVRPVAGRRSAPAARRVVEDVTGAAAAAARRPHLQPRDHRSGRSARRSPARQAWLFVGEIFEHVPVGILRVC